MRKWVIFPVLLAIVAHTGCGKSTIRSSSSGSPKKAPTSHTLSTKRTSSYAPKGSGWKRARGVYHRVKPGETLWRICKTYGVDMQEVAEINDISDLSKIPAGRRIFIPGAKRVLKVDPKRVFGSKGRKKISLQKGKFLWPVRGEISSRFGVRDKRMHNGIDIRASKGRSVRAAQAGRVTYAGSLRGYGKIVVIQHADDYSTVYAHLGRFSVKRGHSVKKGAVIGRVGDSGNASGPHLHFEVRLRGRPRNPMFYLP
ncbi:MAG: LysM peptidoglycan-binding domain-containing M23 family metallopeptidase [Deltaproteobacteria bacterium]|nr:LysM peptidoglycan-binding domain-containing M23 family metallopeptidase [Deltaproteobacteria bacterium]MBW2307314.1 LysM peptidoglycan-binding domain-containing M23 family metallopeptidase [Deltaproteobacteria bacterium]